MLVVGLQAFGLYAVNQRVNSVDFGQTIPTVVALFETSLASKITSSATSATLVSGTDKQGNSLSGTYGFIIDEGSPNEEFILCSATSTALTSCTRGISVTDGKTGVAALQHEHRRGASIKITNYPQLAILSRILNGTEKIPNRIAYESHPSFVGTVASTALITRYYADNLAIAGAPTADTTTKGLVEIATLAELASGTYYGATGASLVATTRDIATSKWSLRYVVTATDNDTYVATFNPVVASLSTGMAFSFLASDGNTGSATFNPNGLGAKTITRLDGTTLGDNEIPPNSIANIIYDGTNMRLLTSQNQFYGTDAGGTDAYAVTIAYSPVRYITGQKFIFKANTANTGEASLNVNSLGAKEIKRYVDGELVDLTTGDIYANQIVTVVYDGSFFQMQGPFNRTSIFRTTGISGGSGSTVVELTGSQTTMTVASNSRVFISSSMDASWTTTSACTLGIYYRQGNNASASFAQVATGGSTTSGGSDTRTVNLSMSGMTPQLASGSVIFELGFSHSSGGCTIGQGTYTGIELR